MYDAVRPASRVEKLEKKLQEMEDAEIRAAQHARRHSPHGSAGLANLGGFSGMAMQQPLAHGQHPHHAHHTHPPPHPPQQLPATQLEYGMFQFQPPPPTFPIQQPQPHRSTSLPQTAGFDGLNWNWPTQAGPSYPATEPVPASAILPTLPWPVISSSNNVSTSSTFWAGQHESPPPEHEDIRPGSSATSQAAMTPTISGINPNITLGSGYPAPAPNTLPDPFSDKLEDLFAPHGPGLGLALGQQQSFSTSTGFNMLGMGGISGGGGGGGMGGGAGVGAAYLDEKDISQSARDYLCVDPWLYLDAVYSAC